MNGKPWVRADIALLRYYARMQPVAAIARMLGRSEAAVYCRAHKLGIRLHKRGPASKYGDAIAREALRRYYTGGESQQQIADALGIPRGSVARWVNGTQRPHLRKEFVR